MRLNVRHRTTYKFGRPMRAVVQSLRMRPSLFAGQSVISWEIDVPGAVRGSVFRDGAGDRIETVSMLGPVDEMTISVTGEVETTDLSGLLRGHRESVPPLAYLRVTQATEPDVALTELAAEARLGDKTDPLSLAHRLSEAVSKSIEYVPGETGTHTSAAEALAMGRGVCQDHAHALISLAYLSDLPARYVTGYLHSSDGTGAPEASHAWAEIWVMDYGWVGFDPSNSCCPDDRYIRLGSGYDASDAAPIRGMTLGLGQEEMEVDVAVQQAEQ